MADLSAAADPGSGHLPGHVSVDGQAVPVAPDHVGPPPQRRDMMCVQRPAALAPFTAAQIELHGFIHSSEKHLLAIKSPAFGSNNVILR